LLSSSSAALVFGLLLVLGAILWVVGGRLAHVTWTRSLVGSDERFDVAVRVDMIERLAMIGQLWCVATLEQAMREERDVSVRDAADRALLVIAARAN
jgi:hypothetical protein